MEYHPPTGLNADSVGAMAIVTNVMQASARNVTKMEYGHAQIVMVAESAAPVQAADCARGVAETRIATDVGTLMASVIFAMVVAMFGNTILNTLKQMMITPAKVAAEIPVAEIQEKSVNIVMARKNATTISTSPPTNIIAMAAANVNGAAATDGIMLLVFKSHVPIATHPEKWFLTAATFMAMDTVIIATEQAFAAIATEQGTSNKYLTIKCL